MKGIVLLSHGSLARGLADAATFFMGDSIEQLEYCCLRQDSSPDEFAEELKRAIEKVDTGEGAVILAGERPATRRPGCWTTGPI